MIQEEAVRQLIEERIQISSVDIAVAKSYIMQNHQKRTSQLLGDFLIEMKIEKIDKVILHDDVDIESQAQKASNLIKWKLAFVEGLWGLINLNMLIISTNNTFNINLQQEWTTVHNRSGGYSGGWSFKQFRYELPASTLLSPSILVGKKQSSFLLSDSDLFLYNLDIPNLGEKIKNGLEQSIMCLKHDLYLPSLVMLGMSIEGAWIELGISLYQSQLLSDKCRERGLEFIDDSQSSILKKMEKILALYNRKDVFKPIYTSSGHNNVQLSRVYHWSNTIREFRNTIHYNKESAFAETYESVACLLLGVKSNFSIIFNIINAINNYPKPE